MLALVRTSNDWEPERTLWVSKSPDGVNRASLGGDW